MSYERNVSLLNRDLVCLVPLPAMNGKQRAQKLHSRLRGTNTVAAASSETLKFTISCGSKHFLPYRNLYHSNLSNPAQCHSYLCIHCTLWVLGSPNTWSSRLKRIASLVPVGYLTVETVTWSAVHRQSQGLFIWPNHAHGSHNRTRQIRVGALHTSQSRSLSSFATSGVKHHSTQSTKYLVIKLLERDM